MKKQTSPAKRATARTTKKEDDGTTDLNTLLEDQLADIYYAEKKLTKATPKMAKAARNPKLSAGFTGHAKETEGQVVRCERAFKLLGKPAKAKKCEAIEGLLKEADELMKEYKGSKALDAALIDAAQKVEHYEIATYGSIIAWARMLGKEKVADLLEQTLNEEKGCDEKLTGLAENSVNAAAE